MDSDTLFRYPYDIDKLHKHYIGNGIGIVTIIEIS